MILTSVVTDTQYFQVLSQMAVKKQQLSPCVLNIIITFASVLLGDINQTCVPQTCFYFEIKAKHVNS